MEQDKKTEQQNGDTEQQDDAKTEQQDKQQNEQEENVGDEQQDQEGDEDHFYINYILRNGVLVAVGEKVPTVYLFGFTGAGKSSLISTLQTAAKASTTALIGGVATKKSRTKSVRDVEVLCNGKTKTVAHMVDTRGWNEGTTADAMYDEICQLVTGGEEWFFRRTWKNRIARMFNRSVTQRHANANCIIIVGWPLLTDQQLREYRALKHMLERGDLGYITGWVLTGLRNEWQWDGNFLEIVAPLSDHFAKISNYVPSENGEEVPTEDVIDHQALLLLERIVSRWSDPELESIKSPVLALWDTAIENFTTGRVTNALWSTLSLTNLINLFLLFVFQNFPTGRVINALWSALTFSNCVSIFALILVVWHVIRTSRA
eukprot:m51a1_g3913 hypothetical protein (374) ;mRNA; f:152560-157622